MTKSVANGRGNAAFFCAQTTAHLSSEKSPQRRKRTNTLIDGVVGGERVLIHQPKPEKERGIMLRIRIALAAAGGVLVWRNEVAKAKRLSDGQIMPFGLGVGSADLICIVAPYGRFLAVEVKRPKLGRVSKEQERWLAVVRRYGGVAGTATTEEEALALLEEARRPPTW